MQNFIGVSGSWKHIDASSGSVYSCTSKTQLFEFFSFSDISLSLRFPLQTPVQFGPRNSEMRENLFVPPNNISVFEEDSLTDCVLNL